MGGFFKGSSGSSSGNAFSPMQGDYEKAQRDYLNRGAQASAEEVMADPRLAMLYGEKGTMGQLGGDIGTARGEEQRLATSGYELQPEDRTAYGQAAGNVARQFGQAESNLARALASRGLSTSGAGTRAFMGAQGNKMEQLAGLQKNIADARMQSNMQRLGQTRNFMLGLMGQQAQLGSQYGQALGQKESAAYNKGNLGMQGTQNMQNQANINYMQQQATAKSSPFSRMMGGVLQSMGADLGPSGGAIGGGLGEALGSSSASPEAGMAQGASKQDAMMSGARSVFGGGGKGRSPAPARSEGGS